MVRQKKATPFFKLGIYCIRLNKATDINATQFVVLTIDPGSKKEAYTIKSRAHTHLNIECDAVDWVKNNVEARKNMRRGRRFRNTPYRQPRWANRGRSRRSDRIPPSTKARWTLKLEMIKKLATLYPIAGIMPEDIKAVSKKGELGWNRSFSPLEVGKAWFYREANKIAPVKPKSGLKTWHLRHILELEKSDDKLSGEWSAHCVDTFAMALSVVGGNIEPDNKNIHYLAPSQYVKAGKRRGLHKCQPDIGGIRVRQGGTRSLGFSKGSIVKYLGSSKVILGSSCRGIFRIGGYTGDKLTILSIDGKGKRNGRVSVYIDPKDVKHLAYNRFKISNGNGGINRHINMG